MEKNLKRKVIAGAAGLAVVAGGGGAYAAVTSGPDKERQAFLNDAAKRLNVDPSKLSDALKGAMEDRIDAAVTAGKLTKAQGEEMKKRIEQNGLPIGPGGGPRGPHGGPFGAPDHGGPFMGGLDAAAKYLGLTNTELRKQLFSGQSLAEIAKAKNKDLAGLKSTIESSVKSNLDTAVKNKRITQAEENDILKNLTSRIDDIVNGKAPVGPRGPGPWHDDPNDPGQNGQSKPGGFSTSPERPNAA